MFLAASSTSPIGVPSARQLPRIMSIPTGEYQIKSFSQKWSHKLLQYTPRDLRCAQPLRLSSL